MRYEGPGFYGINPPLWVSGDTIAKGQWVTSPADHEIYQRIAATGGGTTDPADDVTNYVARSYVRTLSITAPAVSVTGVNAIGSVASTVGAIAIGARTSALSISGRGTLEFLGVAKNATQTMLTEVVVDGRTVLSHSGSYATTTSRIYVGATGFDGTNSGALAIRTPNALVFRRSLQIFLTAETSAGGASCGIAYAVRGEA